MERKYYDAYDERYRQVHGQGLSWFDSGPSAIVGDVLREFQISGKMLELGCGEGRDARFLLERGYDLTATDISPAAIDFCRAADPEHWDCYQVLDCVHGRLDEKFGFIYAVAVVHMLVEDADRAGFYAFLREHLTDEGTALVCTMGDGVMERKSDPKAAFEIQKRVHEASGRKVEIVSTSYRAVSFETFRREIEAAGLAVVKMGLTNIQPDYFSVMYAVVKKN